MRESVSVKSIGACLMGLGVMVLASCGGGQQQQQQAAGEYAVRTLKGESVQFDNSYPGVIQGKNDAEIRPKVAGFITRVAVEEGAVVKKGQVLFTLDDASYRAAVSQAAAAVNSAKAALATAQLNYDNSVELKKKNVIGETGLQTTANALATAKAALAQSEAALASARESLSYCTVVSPTSGVVGSIPYRVGNLVSASMTTALTTVSDIDQMYVYFSISEKQALEMGGKGGASAFPAVRLKLADGSIYASEGKVTTMSGVIDQTTGSISIRADFANPSRQLRSGGSGTVLIPYNYTDAVLVPQSATVEVLDKKYVYIVGKDNKVAYSPIEIATVNDGQNYVVTDGLKIGDRIVVQGVTTLKNEMQITPITEEQAAKKQEMMKQAAAGAAAQK